MSKAVACEDFNDIDIDFDMPRHSHAKVQKECCGTASSAGASYAAQDMYISSFFQFVVSSFFPDFILLVSMYSMYMDPIFTNRMQKYFWTNSSNFHT